MTVWQWGSGLAYEWRLVPMIHQRETFTLLTWQKIIKPKAIKLCVLLSIQLFAIVGTERSDRPGFMCRMCHSSHICRLDKLFLTISKLWKCICVLAVAGRKTDNCIFSRSENFHYLPLFEQQLFTPHSFSQQHQNIVKRHNTNLCIDLIVYMEINVTITQLCNLICAHSTACVGKSVLPDSFLIFWKGSGHETLVTLSYSCIVIQQ